MPLSAVIRSYSRRASPAAVAAACLLALGAPARAADAVRADGTGFEVELLGVQGLRSDARLPTDTMAVRNALESLTRGARPLVPGRTEAVWPLGERVELRGLVAPLSAAGSPLMQDLAWRGGAANDAAALARSDSYRLTWRYAWVDSPQLAVKLGVTASLREHPTAVGGTLVGAPRAATMLPLLHASVESPFGAGLALAADVDALAGPFGRAMDAGVRLRYAVDRDWSASVSYRILDGTTGSAAPFSASRFQYLGVGVRRAF